MARGAVAAAVRENRSMSRLWKPIRPPGVSGATMRVRVSGNGGAASSTAAVTAGWGGRAPADARGSAGGTRV